MTMIDEMAEAIEAVPQKPQQKENMLDGHSILITWPADDFPAMAQAAYAVLEKKIGKEALKALLDGSGLVTIGYPREK